MTIFVESGHVNEYPYNHARIIYGNATNAAVSATGADTDYPAALVLTETTYERWKPAASGDSITMAFTAGNYNAIALAALSDLNFTLEVRQVGSPVFEAIKMFRPDDGETLSADFTEPDYSLLDYSPDNQAIIILLKKRQLNAIRITVNYEGTAPTLGVIRVGNVLEMARPFYQGHNPAILSSNSTVRPNVSDSGEWLGASLIRQSRSLSMSWNNLKADWVRKNWVPFSQTLKTKPFFIAWNPLRFPSDCFYATAQQEPKPTNSGPRDYQSITLTATAYSDGSDPVVESLGSKTFSELFTFSRDSEATYYDVNGILQTANNDEPRFTYDPITNEAEGLLIEEARSNVLTDTSLFTDVSWVLLPLGLGKAPVLEANAAIGLDGKLSATKITFDCGGGTTISDRSRMLQTITGGSAGADYTGSFWARLSSGSGQICFRHAAFGSYTTVSLTDSWQRIELVESASSSTLTYEIATTGNVTPGPLEVYIWGAQLEQGAFTTSYMPSTEAFTSRASTAQYIDGNGDWQLAAVNQERANAYGYDESGNLEYIGQLLEPARTNSFTYPRLIAPFGVWSFVSSTGYINAEVAPDGTLSASKIVPNTTSANHYPFRSLSVTSGSTYTFSCYVKAGEYRYCALPITNTGFGAASFPVFDLQTGSVIDADGSTVSITPAGNGWYRCSATRTAIASATGTFSLYVLPTSTVGAYAGDGTSGIYVWGAQLEVGAFPTSLTPDATTFSSRAGFASYYDSNGVMQEAAINEYRENTYGYDSNGTLQLAGPVLEPSTTNEWIYSEDIFISGIGKTRSFIQPYQEFGQTGGIAAGKFIPDGSAATTHYAAKVVNFSAGSLYTFSVYAKAAEFTTLALDLPSGQFGSVQRVLFDLTDGTVSFPNGNNLTHYGSQPVGDGWYRIWITSTCTSSGLGAALLLLFDNDGNVTFDGDYNSGVYVWGAQVEARSFPSSYILEGTTWSSRASTATYYDSNGIIQTASSGVARDAAYYPKDGVFYPIGRTLIEVASTNLALQSEALDNAAWAKGGTTITANATTAPDGASTADKVVLNSATVSHYAATNSISFTSGTVYTMSIYVKYIDWQYFNMILSGVVSTEYAVFDLVNGTVTGGTYTRANMTAVANGWYRCELTFIAAATTSGSGYPIWFSESASSIRAPSFTGDGSSSVYAWGAQVESYSPAPYTAYYATSYIPTTSSTVTRAADVFTSGAVFRASDISSSPSVTRAADVYTSTAGSRAADLCTRTPGVEFNKTAFTVYVEAAYSDDAIEVFFDANSGATDNDANRINLYRSNLTNTFVGYIKDNAGTSASRSISGTDGAGTAKVALSFDGSTGAFIAAANGTSSSTTTTITEINPTRFIVGDKFDLTQYNLNDAIKNLKIYPVALSATELETLTT